MGKLFGTTESYNPVPCRIEVVDGENFTVDDWRIWSDALLECDRSDGTTVYVPMENLAQIVEIEDERRP